MNFHQDRQMMLLEQPGIRAWETLTLLSLVDIARLSHTPCVAMQAMLVCSKAREFHRFVNLQRDCADQLVFPVPVGFP